MAPLPPPNAAVRRNSPIPFEFHSPEAFAPKTPVKPDFGLDRPQEAPSVQKTKRKATEPLNDKHNPPYPPPPPAPKKEPVLPPPKKEEKKEKQGRSLADAPPLPEDPPPPIIKIHWSPPPKKAVPNPLTAPQEPAAAAPALPPPPPPPPPAAPAQLAPLQPAPIPLTTSRVPVQYAGALYISGGSYEDKLVLRRLAVEFPVAYEVLVGLYFQEPTSQTPWQIAKQQGTALCQGWIRNPRIQDLLATGGQNIVDHWSLPENDERFKNTVADVARRLNAFEASILWWAQRDEPYGYNVSRVLRKAGWIPQLEIHKSQEWETMHNIFKMDEGREKEAYLEQAKKESPRLYDFCLQDIFCGSSSYRRERESPGFGQDRFETVATHYLPTGRTEHVVKSAPIVKPVQPNMPGPRPTQIHSVPIEERAFDSKGNRLPWALEWPDDHPNARGQKRRVEEKGPFGKGNRRRGSSRTRTATPAKKETLTIDSFDKALTYDLSRAESPPDGRSLRAQGDINLAVDKEPTQVIIYGYAEDQQWRALSFVEKVSYGMICEDYDRQAPEELQRYPSAITKSPHTRRRPLTKKEVSMVNVYNGGVHWVKVTLDSAEAAERVQELSPLRVAGHWVYVQAWHGVEPENDEAIPLTEEEMIAKKPLRKHPLRGRASQMLKSQAEEQDSGSITTNTASSGTATGPDQSNLRNRRGQQDIKQKTGNIESQDPQTMRFFPDQPRTVLRPAHEAFASQSTWWEQQMKWLSDKGLLPGEIIGSGPPTNDNGEFEYAKANFYWRFFYWIDSHFGSDLCGLRPEPEGET